MRIQPGEDQLQRAPHKMLIPIRETGRSDPGALLEIVKERFAARWQLAIARGGDLCGQEARGLVEDVAERGRRSDGIEPHTDCEVAVAVGDLELAGADHGSVFVAAVLGRVEDDVAGGQGR